MLLIKGLVDDFFAKTRLHICQRPFKSVNGKIWQFQNPQSFHEELLQFSPLKYVFISNLETIESGTSVVFATLNVY